MLKKSLLNAGRYLRMIVFRDNGTFNVFFYLFVVTDSEKVFFISVTALSLNTILPVSFKYFLDQYNDHV